MWCPEQKIHSGHQIKDYVVSRTNKVGNPLVADRNVLNVINVFKSNHFQNVY